MMQKILCLAALTALSISVVSQSADLPVPLLPIPGMRSGLLGKAPPGDHWIWFSVPGPRSYPIPVLYISTATFEIVDLETLIVLPEPSFEIAQNITKAAVSNAECPNDKGSLKRFTVEIVETHSGRLSRCALAQKRTCDLLADLKYSPNIDWDDKKLNVLDRFGRSIQCEPDVLFKEL